MYCKVRSFLMVFLVISMSLMYTDVPAYAGELANDNNMFKSVSNNSYDVLSLSQGDYDVLNEKACEQNDNIAIKTLCESFLSVSRASVRDQKYSATKYLSDDSRNKKTIQYRLSEYDYLKELYASRGYSIIKDSVFFDGYKCKINEDTAEASIVEHYSYFINDGFDDANYRIREYYFSLNRDNDAWYITDMKTNDACELSIGFTYEPIDIQYAIIDEPIDTSDPHDSDVLPMVTNYAPYQWSYNRSVAVSYASQYYNSVNSFFGSNTYDCQNFASQCVWAGLRGSYSNPTSYVDLPAVKKSIVANYLQSAWYRNVNTGYYRNTYLNWTWDNVGGFAYLLQCSANYPIGPKGSTTYGSVSYVGTADVIAYCTSGSPSATNLSHAMFVTGVTGTYGSRTKDNIKIAAHSSNTNSAYQTLSSYTSYAANKFSRTYISAGYYPSPKN